MELAYALGSWRAVLENTIRLETQRKSFKYMRGADIAAFVFDMDDEHEFSGEN